MRSILQKVHRRIHQLSELRWSGNTNAQSEFMELCEERIVEYLSERVFEDPEVLKFIENNPESIKAKKDEA